jgi:squalene-associated FAD-dependent desaturase
MTDLIIGGGFAGLSAGVALAAAGRAVMLLERRAFLGGRAYSFTDRVTGETVDNGQHLMMGCYHATLDFLAQIGAKDKIKIQPNSRVDFLDEREGYASFNCPPLPAPLHLLGGLCRLRTLTWGDRFAALRVGLALRRINGRRAKLADLTVSQWLDSLGQPERLQRRFWAPLALATLNEAPERASADMLARVIEEAFMRTRRDSMIVISRVGLSDLYTEDARRFIETRGGEVKTGAEVAAIEFADARAVAVRLKTGERINAQTVTSSVPPSALVSLLPAHLIERQAAFQNLSSFKSSPIISVNLWYDEPVTDLEFVGLLDSRIEWVFNKNAIVGKNQRQQHLALVTSGAHEAARMPKEELIEMATAEMRRFFPAARSARLNHAHVVREHEATISHTVGVAKLRPPQRTGIENFYLAGDWTETGLPATIEGAVRSGRACAEAIIGKDH